MNRRWTALAAALMFTSCRSPAPDPPDESIDAGAGAGPVKRRYELRMADVWKAAEEAVSEEDVTIERRRRDELGGELVGRRIDGHRVKVWIRQAPGDGTDTGVCVEPPNRELAGMVQGRIGEKLSLKKARTDLFGERSVESAHAADLSRCMEAAERTCRVLDLEVVHKQVQERSGRLEARDASGRAVRFTLQPAPGPGRETGAVLSTDAPAEGGEPELLRKVRREFERQLFPSAD